MSSILDRHAYDHVRSESGRAAAVLLMVVLGAALWRSLGLEVRCWMASRSVGCWGREKLVAAALWNEEAGIPIYDEGVWRFRKPIMMGALPAPGWVAWHRPIVEPNRIVYQLWFADHLLRWKGRVFSPQWTRAPPEDVDGDGHWELLLQYAAEPYRPGAPTDARFTAVVRLGEHSNELAWAGLTGFDRPANADVRIYPIWRDEDGDDLKELVFITRELKSRPAKGFKPARTVAVLAWDRRSGRLQPRDLPENCGVRPWQAPSGQPAVFDPDEELLPILRRLLPLGDEAGYQPSSSAQSWPTSAPGGEN